MLQVNPSWQRTGLGRAMLERMIGSLAAEDIGTITLYAEAKVVGLYEKLSFVQDPQGIKVMLPYTPSPSRHISHPHQHVMM